MKGNEKRANALFLRIVILQPFFIFLNIDMLHKGNTKHIQNDNNKQENEIETI